MSQCRLLCAMVVLVWAVLIAFDGMALGQGYTWDRTYRHVQSIAGALGDLPDEVGDADSENSGVLDNDFAGAAAMASASWSDGQGSSASFYAETDGECEWNADDQATMEWSFIHSEQVDADASGPNGYAYASTGQGSWTKGVAELTHPDQNPDATVGRLNVDIGWTAGGTGDLYVNKEIYVEIEFGSAFLTITSSGAVGTDGWGEGNSYSKSFSAPLSAFTGTLVIGPSEFTAPLVKGNGARIEVNAGQGQDILSSLSAWALSPWITESTLGEVFQGVIGITADNP